MMNVKNLIVCFMLMSMSQLAIAVQNDGIYVAFDLGRSTYRNACEKVSTVYSNCSDFDQSHRFSFGLEISPQTSAELSFFNAGKTIRKDSGINSDVIDDSEWQLSGIRYFPIGDGRLSTFGRLGVVHWAATETIFPSNPISASGNSILFGIGAKYYLTISTVARVQFETHKVGNSSISWRGNINFLSTGLAYSF
jgi:hypothetical protein